MLESAVSLSAHERILISACWDIHNTTNHLSFSLGPYTLLLSVTLTGPLTAITAMSFKSSSCPNAHENKGRIPDYDLIDYGDSEATVDDHRLVRDHSIATAPVFTEDAYNALGPIVFPEKAVYGRLLSQKLGTSSEASHQICPCVYVNTNAPFSAVVCGVQVYSANQAIYLV
jgi:hypothetical protein